MPAEDCNHPLLGLSLGVCWHKVLENLCLAQQEVQAMLSPGSLCRECVWNTLVGAEGLCVFPSGARAVGLAVFPPFVRMPTVQNRTPLTSAAAALGPPAFCSCFILASISFLASACLRNRSFSCLAISARCAFASGSSASSCVSSFS